MKVLIVEPGYSPYEADIENTPAALTAVLESEQYTAAFPFDNTVIAAVYGGDAEKPYNRTLGSIGLVQGRFIVCGSRRGRFVGLTREQAQRYSRRLHFPEKFEERDGRLYSLPCDPKIKPKGLYCKGTGIPRIKQAVTAFAAQKDRREKGHTGQPLRAVYHQQPNMERGLILWGQQQTRLIKITASLCA